jgi:hypothetical protein
MGHCPFATESVGFFLVEEQDWQRRPVGGMLPPSIVQVVQFAFDIGVCVVLLGWIDDAFIDCRVLGKSGGVFCGCC